MENKNLVFFKDVYLLNRETITDDEEYKYMLDKIQDIFTLLLNETKNKNMKIKLAECQNIFQKLLVCHGALAIKLGIDKTIEANQNIDDINFF